MYNGIYFSHDNPYALYATCTGAVFKRVAAEYRRWVLRKWHQHGDLVLVGLAAMHADCVWGGVVCADEAEEGRGGVGVRWYFKEKEAAQEKRRLFWWVYMN